MEQVQREAYRYLDAALPLRHKNPVKTNALFDFVIEEPAEFKDIVTDSEELHHSTQKYLVSKREVHQIGDSLSLLFKEPIYKSYNKLSLIDNSSFASCRLDEQNGPPEHCDLPAPQGSLEFESRFESGNLALAAQGNISRHYWLALQRDTNSESLTTQWFYFRVRNRDNTGLFTFHIVNYVKPFSMFKAGMKPCVFSVKSGRGWQRAGTAIEYRKNSIQFDEDKPYFTLSFSYEITHQDDQVFFAYCYPYTYTRLQRFLDIQEAKHTDKMRRKVLTKTHANNIVEMVLITNPQLSHKRTLVISARVHPGETIGSFVVEAIILFLLSQSSHPDAEKLRNQFILKIIPMLNPDGVIHGNYRTSLSGDDLNRQWKNPDKNKHPEIWAAKKSIVEGQYKKALYIDIHGHSKKKSSFMYGCISAKSPYRAKELPYILYKNMAHFSYFSCNFSMHRSKEGTSRIALWRSGIDLSYTYQLSFCGPQRQRRHFNLRDYELIGVELCLTLSKYFYSRVLQLEPNEEVNRHCEEFYNDQELLNMGNEDTNGSSSELEDEVFIEMVKTDPKVLPRSNHRRHSTNEKAAHSINHLLENYLAKYAGKEVPSKVDHEWKSYDQSRKRVEADKQVYMRHRQSFMATKVNLQEMALQDHLFASMSTFYGLASDKNSQQQPSANLKTPINHSVFLSERKQYKNESYGVLLPNVQKSQYKRYERPRRKPMSEQRSVSVHLQSVIQQTVASQVLSNRSGFSAGPKIKKEMSLVQKIRSRTTDRRDTKF